MKMTMIERADASDVPEKALKFLRAVATWNEVKAAMAAAGYTEEEHALGWRLFHEATGFGPLGIEPRFDAEVRGAIAALDGLDESTLTRVRAALRRFHPEQEAFVFAGLEPGQGVNAVVSMALLLERLDALERAPERAATRDADHAALATLAARGIDAKERARLAELVATAKSVRLDVPEPDDSAEQRDRALLELTRWYADWADTARAVVKRRDLRLALGFGKRRRASAAPDEARTEDEPAPEAEAGAAPSAGTITV
jgi:hypothetical protein